MLYGRTASQWMSLTQTIVSAIATVAALTLAPDEAKLVAGVLAAISTIIGALITFLTNGLTPASAPTVQAGTEVKVVDSQGTVTRQTV